MDQFGGVPKANQQDMPQHTEAQKWEHLTRQRVQRRLKSNPADIALKLADQIRDFERQDDVNERAFEDTGQIHLQLRDELREGGSRGEVRYLRDLLNCGLWSSLRCGGAMRSQFEAERRLLR